jgi:hypothetical protein
MKILFILLLSFTGYNSQGQIKVSYTFRDACNDSLIKIPYVLFQPGNSKSYRLPMKNLILDSPGVYTFGASICRSGEDMIFRMEKFYNTGKTYADTIFIPRLLPWDYFGMYEGYNVFYFCGSRASGLIKDYYQNGVIRMEGSFLNGVPKSDIKYYNVNGRLVKKEIYRSGQFIELKFYNKQDKIDYY